MIEIMSAKERGATAEIETEKEEDGPGLDHRLTSDTAEKIKIILEEIKTTIEAFQNGKDPGAQGMTNIKKAIEIIINQGTGTTINLQAKNNSCSNKINQKLRSKLKRIRNWKLRKKSRRRCSV